MADNRLPFFLTGVGLGTALGLLVAPKSGDRIRADLRQGARSAGEFVAQNSDGIRRAANDALERGKQAAQSQRGQFEGALEAGIEAYRKAVGRL